MRLLDQLSQDVRYALRLMARSRGFTAVAVLSLALGIGANTAIFSLIDTLMLRMLPVQHPEQLVQILTQFPQPGEPRMGNFTRHTFDFFRERNHVFTGITTAVSRWAQLHVRGEASDAQPGDAAFVEGTFFPLLGVRPAFGRVIAPENDQPASTAAAVAVLSWNYWKNRFAMDPAVIGKRVLVEDVPFTVIGVAAPDFTGLQVGEPQDAWVPLSMMPHVIHNVAQRDVLRTGPVIARLKPGVSLEEARSEMTVLFHQAGDDEVRTSNNELRKYAFFVEPAGAGLSDLRDQYARPLLVLMAVVGLMLLIACTNVASMMLARGAARRHETALRVSLGAGRLRLIRQVLTESVLLSVTGTLIGILVAFLGTRVLLRVLESAREPVSLDVQPDFRVLLFTAAIALLAGILFGLAPALHALSTAPVSALRDGGRSGDTRAGRAFGKALVAAQVALSIVLLSAAGLFVRHLENLRGPDLGFHPDHVLLVSLGSAGPAYDRARLASAYDELAGRMATIPGVRSAAITGVSPIRNMGAGRSVMVEGYQAAPGERRRVSLNWISPHYFETMGIPVLVGRDFSPRDRGGPLVTIVSQTFARYYFGNANPIGRHVQFDEREGSYEIVGVAADAKYSDAHEPMVRVMYLDLFQDWMPTSNFALRTRIDPAAVAGAARRAVHDVLPAVAVNRVITLTDQIDESIVPERLVAMLSSLFGVLGAVLAAVGLYGLLAYTVARRIAEIGIRMALGATTRDVSRMVLVDALVMVCAGLIAGVPLTIWAKRFAASVVEGLRLEIGLPVAIGAAAMLAITLLASYLPARRAARVDPMIALRYE